MTLAQPVDEAWRRRTAERRAALRRARVFATTLLFVMLVVFSLCWWYEPALPWLGYPRAFAEAGVIGAVADWFAVVALFRRPMGLPIPHTAILPRNKQRMGDALGLFIASNFLAPAEIEQRLDRIDASGWITQWLAEPDHIRMVVRGSQGLLPPALELLGQEQIRGLLLKQGQIRLRLEQPANASLVQLPVGLGAGGPHRGSLAGVQRAKLNSSLVGGDRHRTAESIDLPDEVALADAADGRIAAHLPQSLDAVRE